MAHRLTIGEESFEKNSKQAIYPSYKKSAYIINIYDNYLAAPGLKTDWGFSCLIKTKNQNILFDTGRNTPGLFFNMQKMKIDPGQIDVVVISHIHNDHTGGLIGILKKSRNIKKVYIPNSFPAPLKEEIKYYGGNIENVKEPREIVEGLWTTGELETRIHAPEWPSARWGTLKEQSLILHTNSGVALIVGCGHPLLTNIIKKTKKLTGKKIHLVLGGFSLAQASDSKIKNIIKDFRDFGIKKVAPCHCSGERTRELFKEEYHQNLIFNGAGKTIELEPEYPSLSPFLPPSLGIEVNSH